MSSWTVGQPCIVIARDTHEATVTKVARKYLTVLASGREYEFEIATGRYHGQHYGSGIHLSTVEAYAASQRRSAVYTSLRALLDNWHRIHLSDSQLDELAGVIGRMT